MVYIIVCYKQCNKCKQQLASESELQEHVVRCVKEHAPDIKAEHNESTSGVMSNTPVQQSSSQCKGNSSSKKHQKKIVEEVWYM